MHAYAKIMTIPMAVTTGEGGGLFCVRGSVLCPETDMRRDGLTLQKYPPFSTHTFFFFYIWELYSRASLCL
jgi:hypothetical protein